MRKIIHDIDNHVPKREQKKPLVKKKKSARSSKAAWHEIGGKRHYFRSSWEPNVALYLEFIKSKGEILDWEYEPQRFMFEMIKRGTTSYLPDFRITELDGSYSFIEVKGYKDKVSMTKIKRFLKYYPQYKLTIIDSHAYKQLKQFARLIPGWVDIS